MEITYRPCKVQGKNALFHRWSDKKEVINPIFSGQSDGQLALTVGIIEYEDGSIHECYPWEIMFVDDKVKKYFKKHCTTYKYRKDRDINAESIKLFLSNLKPEDIENHASSDIYDEYVDYCIKNKLKIYSKQNVGYVINKHFGVKSITKRYGDVVRKTYTKV